MCFGTLLTVVSCKVRYKTSFFIVIIIILQIGTPVGVSLQAWPMDLSSVLVIT